MNAPVTNIEYNIVDTIYIVEPIKEIDTVLSAFIQLESNYDSTAVNPVSRARGILQILPVMIDEANRLSTLKGNDVHYTWDDAWSIDKSIEIWYLVQGHHNPTYNIPKACRVWFGSGVQYDGMTWVQYYNKILKYIKAIK